MKKRNASIIAALSLTTALSIFGLVKAATITVNLGAADSFAILAGTKISNVPGSSITGDVGLSPAAGSNYQGLTAAEVSGKIYDVNGTGPLGSVNNPTLLTTAQNDLTTAFIDAAGRSPVTVVPTELGGTTKTPGIYASNSSTFGITAGAGYLVLDAQNDPSAVFIFEMNAEGTGLTVGPSSTVSLIRGAQPCNVFWRVNTASIDTAAVFKGNVLALNSVSVAKGANIEGRLLARNGAVTLDQSTVVAAKCVPVVSRASDLAIAAGVANLPSSGASSDQSSSFRGILGLSTALAASLSLVIALRDSQKKSNNNN